ncbi:Zinc transporter ZupT [Chitinophaga costaii]|uniref:Zinc transporter ZupT n=1 Tax=Chitinophaga costaii TaxID=1335309 RepID=A0A1C3ZIE6_9BACT|nr:ZIP family metal transporter [Chitinophaga costaii]PUZ30386.1 hypothetical protein DCM91_02620 [Chitinophaga costaii]SCB82124.1 Zinc transporter ZupT [Chitinophaga costaii]
MNWTYLIFIFIATLTGGIIALRAGKAGHFMVYLLAFTGAFLFGITIMHLLPEVFAQLGSRAGIYVVLGFFIQVALAQLSHGMEHGHTHMATPGGAGHHHIAIAPLLVGLSLHAFMEGLPLGFHYQDAAAIPSLMLGVALHKLPESLALMTVMVHGGVSKPRLWAILVGFGLVTPLAAILAWLLGQTFSVVADYLVYVVALVIGAFIHIATTIFFESGTRYHEISGRKVIAIAGGILLAFVTMIFE